MYQSKAWVFSAVLVLCLCWSSILVVAQNGITDPVEVSALREIKKCLIDPNKNLTNWNRGDPCTVNWTGVSCFNSALEDGYLHVQELQLLNMNLSGTLSPQLGRLSRMQYCKALIIFLEEFVLNSSSLQIFFLFNCRNFMWNNLTGTIPKEIGNITSLKLLLLNGNQLSGSLPEELGNLATLFGLQIDENKISGPIPKSFAKLSKTMHFHMNNNSISGQIPSELSRLPSVIHFLLDNNNLSGHLPPELSELPELLILQVDNNNFSGTTIPESYSNMSKLLKLSLRNCGLRGPIPDLSRIPKLGYIDLSSNQLSGPIPPDKLSDEIKTIDLSNNELTGTIPSSFSQLPQLQKLSVANNSLNGSVSSSIWTDRTLNSMESLKLEFQNNRLNSIVGSTNIPPNVTISLQGNPVCNNDNTSLVQFCGPQNENRTNGTRSPSSNLNCPAPRCPFPYEFSKTSIVKCFCAIPLVVEYRLKSPGFSDFVPYITDFERYLSSGLHVHQYQLEIVTFQWEKGPRLRMTLKLFPMYVPNTSYTFNTSEVRRIINVFARFNIPNNDLFGPYELRKYTLLGPYANVFVAISGKSGISKKTLVGGILGGIAAASTLSAIVSLVILRMRMKRSYQTVSKRRRLSKISLQIGGVKDFSYGEMASATNDFDSLFMIGQGGYGKVYKGILVDGTVVAIKRAQEGSLQGEKEFLTEIELLSRLHHRNLVSLIGFCDEEGEQMLVYEFMPNGTLRDQLSAKSEEPLTFALRVRIALGSAKGILYLHTEANPPIFHRDIKASNILLDSKFTAKVADFGLSRLAPVPEIEGNVPAHVSTVVRGTPGYLDPEYMLTHKLTDKSDVYSLGVVFLELLTGMHPITHGKNLVREVNTAFQSGTIFSVIDGRMGFYPSDCVEKFLRLALKCCQDDTDSRPSMAEVVRQLENICLMMPESDTKTTEHVTSPKAGKEVTPPSSSSEVKHPYLSLDDSGSNLVSGVIPTIEPR